MQAHGSTHTCTGLWDAILIGRIWISMGAFLLWNVLYSNGFSVIWCFKLFCTLIPPGACWKMTKEKLIQQFPEFHFKPTNTFFWSHMVSFVIGKCTVQFAASTLTLHVIMSNNTADAAMSRQQIFKISTICLIRFRFQYMNDINIQVEKNNN